MAPTDQINAILQVDGRDQQVLAPKVNSPRKLSGKRTVLFTNLESGSSLLPANGITFSGKKTEGLYRQLA